MASSSSNPNETVDVLAVIDCHNDDINLAESFRQALLSTVFRCTRGEAEQRILLRSELDSVDEDDIIKRCRCVFVIYSENYSLDRRCERRLDVIQEHMLDADQLLLLPVTCGTTPKTKMLSSLEPIEFGDGEIKPLAIRKLSRDIFKIHLLQTTNTAPRDQPVRSSNNLLPSTCDIPTRPQQPVLYSQNHSNAPALQKPTPMKQVPVPAYKCGSIIEMESLGSITFRPQFSSQSQHSTSFVDRPLICNNNTDRDSKLSRNCDLQHDAEIEHSISETVSVGSPVIPATVFELYSTTPSSNVTQVDRQSANFVTIVEDESTQTEGQRTRITEDGCTRKSKNNSTGVRISEDQCTINTQEGDEKNVLSNNNTRRSPTPKSNRRQPDPYNPEPLTLHPEQYEQK